MKELCCAHLLKSRRGNGVRLGRWDLSILHGSWHGHQEGELWESLGEEQLTLDMAWHLGLRRWRLYEELACQYRRCKRYRFNAQVRRIPWRRVQQPAPVFLPGESYGQRRLVGYRPQGFTELDTTKATQSAQHVHMAWCLYPGFTTVQFKSNSNNIYNLSFQEATLK